MSTLFVDTINEKTTNAGVNIPGHVIQVVTASLATAASTTSNTFVDTALTASITPSSSSSKILVLGSISLYSNSVNGVATATIDRGTYNLGDSDFGLGYIYNSNGSIVSQTPIVLLDSPSTTSATTYKVQLSRSSQNIGTAYISVNSTPSKLTLLEIGG